MPVLLTIYVRPTITPHKTAETHQNSRRKSREGTQNRVVERGERETGRETVSTMDEAASTTDDLGSVDPDVAPGAEPLVDSSPATAAAAAAAAGVEVVSAPNRCLLYTSPSPRDGLLSRMPSSA